MKYIHSICLLLFVFPLFSQFTEVELGKMNHPWYDREIKAENVGVLNASYGKLFFKLGDQADFQKAGFFAGRLKSHLDLTIPEVKESIRQYKCQKRISYAIGGGAVLSFYTFALICMEADEELFTPISYFPKNSVPWLIAYMSSSLSATYMFYSAEDHLLDAVRAHNQVHGQANE